MAKNEYSYIAKIITSHQLTHIGFNELQHIINDDNIIKIFLYRSSIENSLLSFVYALKYGFNKDDVISDVKIKFSENRSGLFGLLLQFPSLLQMYYAYKSKWDYVIDYDSFTGNHVNDFFFYD